MKPLTFTGIKKNIAVGICLATAIFLFLQPVAACSWDYSIWQNRSEYSEPYYRFLKDGKAGFIDRTGKIVIEPVLRDRGNGQPGIINGLLEIDSFKYVDIKTGKEVSEEFYEQATEPARDWASKSTNYGYGFIDRDGKTLVEPKYPFARDFSEGLAAVVLKGPCVYYSKGVCGGDKFFYPVWTQKEPENQCEFSFIDRQERVISARTFLDVKDFSEGLAAVKTAKGWGYLGKSGKIVIEPQFDDADPFSEGLALVERDGKLGFINSAGTFVIEPQFESALSFSDGLAVVGADGDKTVDNKFYYIDKKGKRLTNDTFLLGSRFFKGIAHVLISQTFKTEMRDGEEWAIRTQTFAYINRKGEKIFVYTDEDKMN
jgi:hypothetical protein